MLILPPNDKGSKFQRSKSCLSWVKSGEKLALNMPWKTCVIQIPKYLNFCGLIRSGNKLKSIPIAAVFTGIISHFCRLILYPDTLPNSSNRDKAFGILVKGSDRYKSMSSAYNDTLFSKSYLCFPLILISPRNAKASGSIAMANRRGDREQTCRVPRRRGK